MFIKRIVGLTVFSSCLSSAFAASIYINPTLQYDGLVSEEARFQGATAVLHVGYGDWVRDWLLLSLDAFAGPKYYEFNSRLDEGINLRPGYIYGLSVIPAIVLDETITAYARVGYIAAQFSSLDTIKSGSQIGVGVSAKLLDDWSITAEYDYASYTSISALGKLKSDEFSLGLLYRVECF